MSQAIYCIRHPDVETSVSCGRCGDPICPRCLVHAPVGVRCPDCGRSRPAPTFDVSSTYLLRGVAAGAGVALVGSILAWLVIWYVQVPLLPALLIAGLGYGIGESISLATNRKRGTRLKVAAGLCMLLAFSAIMFLTGMTIHPINLIVGALAFYMAIMRF